MFEDLRKTSAKVLELEERSKVEVKKVNQLEVALELANAQRISTKEAIHRFMEDLINSIGVQPMSQAEVELRQSNEDLKNTLMTTTFLYKEEYYKKAN